MQIHQSDSGFTIKFEPEPLCPRVEWIYDDTYAIYSYRDKAVVSASGCYKIIAHIAGIDIDEVDGHLADYLEEQNSWTTGLHRPTHDVFFERQANLILPRFTNIRVVNVRVCEDCRLLDGMPHSWVAESTKQDCLHLCGYCANHIETKAPYGRFAFVPSDARPEVSECRINESIHKYPVYDFDNPQINDRYSHLIKERI